MTPALQDWLQRSGMNSLSEADPYGLGDYANGSVIGNSTLAKREDESVDDFIGRVYQSAMGNGEWGTAGRNFGDLQNAGFVNALAPVNIGGQDYQRVGENIADPSFRQRLLANDPKGNIAKYFNQYDPASVSSYDPTNGYLMQKDKYDELVRAIQSTKPGGWMASDGPLSAFSQTIGPVMGLSGALGALGFADGGYQSLWSSLSQNAASQGGSFSDFAKMFGSSGGNVPANYWNMLADAGTTTSDASSSAAGTVDTALTNPGTGIGGAGRAGTGLVMPATAGGGGGFDLSGLGSGLGLAATNAAGVPLSEMATGLGGIGAGTAALGGAASGGGNFLSSIANWLTPSSGVGGLQALGLLSSGIGSIAGALGATSAANTAANAANRATDTQLGMFNTINEQQLPYRLAGYSSLGAILGGLGLGPASGGVNSGQFTHQFDANDLKTNLAPNYQFQLDQGLGAVRNEMNRSGGLVSGNTLKGINDYAQNFAGNSYQNAFNNYNANQTNIFNRLSNIAGLGQTANQNVARAGTSLANSAGQNIVNAGQAQAAGRIGLTNSITNGLNNAMGWYSLPSILNLSNGSANG